ncbi:MAG: DNA primase [Syntrophomonadaceae bacterium]|nr:DNA primase [Syntrophomonadaceae bacterium]
MTTYDNRISQEISDRLDIVDIVAETVKLTRKGNRYWGLCPFHAEKTPSFSVTPERNMFYCFGCHAGGDIFSFVMKRDGLDFKEALEMLAARAGVKLVSTSGSRDQEQRKKVIEVNRAAAEFYHQILLSRQGGVVQKYLENRGIKQETILAYKLGYAPEQWNRLEEYLLKKGFSQEYVKLSGLIKRNENRNSYYDLFRNRLMFPIFQYNGDILGFGGRVLDDTLPKYINTPETELYSKRQVLYGLYQARQAIRSNNEAVLLEGYMDCIKLQQAGISNCVASLGTALTPEQARLLCRYTENVLILYDGDEAGQRETLRAIDVLAEEALKVQVVTLPAGKDPDDFLEINGKEEFLQYIQNNKLSHIEFKINRYLKEEKTINLEVKVKIINALKKDINNLKSPIEKDYYVKVLAQKMLMEPNLIYRELQLANKRQNPTDRNKTQISRDNIQYGNYSKDEKILAAMLKDEKTFAVIKDNLGLNFLARSEYKNILNIFDQLKGNQEERLVKLGEIMQQEGMAAVYARIVFLMEEINVEEAEVNEFICRVQALKIEARWQKIYQHINFLKVEGDFENLLKFVLNLDSFLNETREGGI